MPYKDPKERRLYNQQKIKDTWPEYWKQYKEFGGK